MLQLLSKFQNIILNKATSFERSCLLRDALYFRNTLRCIIDEYHSERGYLVRTLASHPGVPGSNLIAAPKSSEVYPSLGILQEEVFFN